MSLPPTSPTLPSAVVVPEPLSTADTRRAWRDARQALLADFTVHPQRVSGLVQGLSRAADQSLRTLWAE
ncbi:MAG: hypothetical protein KGL51_02625, partial [Betaproteobacteria bacterium]|nr:hypothetical protein [Betaproteobacteria bacterium]